MIEPETRMWMAVMNRIYLDSKSTDSDIKTEVKQFLDTPEFDYICGVVGIPPEKAVKALDF